MSSPARIMIGNAREHPLPLRVASTVGIVGMAAGVPILLLGARAYPPVGGMLHLVLHPDLLGHLVAGPFTDDIVTKLVWLGAWVAWSWLVVCVGVEVIGVVRGRAPSRVPGSRHIQALVACLVGASLAVAVPARHQHPLRLDAVGVQAAPHAGPQAPEGSTRATSLRSTRPTRSTQPPRALVRSGGTGPDRAPRAHASETAWVTPAPPTYTVQPGDTLWSIAGSELGSPLDWHLIATANYGRVQSDGQALTDDHWIRPGWLLVIPPVGSPVVPVVPVESSSTVVLPRLTTAVSENGHPDAQKTDARVAPGREVPGREAAPRGVPVLPIGYGLLGAGVVALLDRMRRAQQRRRLSGLRIALPQGDVVELERGLRLAADQGAAEWINLSLRLLSVMVRRAKGPPPPVMAVRLREDAVELLLDPGHSVGPPPPPFENGTTGSSWLLARSGALMEALRADREVAGNDAPLPSLVTLGKDERGLLVVNLEKAGSVAISGDGTACLIQSIAAELATSAWADQIDLVLVGFGDQDKGLERVSHSDSLRAVGQKLERRIRERQALLALGEHATNAETRWLDGGDAWDLCVVVCSSSTSAEESETVASITSLVGDGSFGVIAVFGGSVPTARWHVRAEAGRVSVEGASPGWPSVSGQAVPSDLVDGINSLVTVASDTDGVSPHDMPYSALSMPIPELVAVPERGRFAALSHDEGSPGGRAHLVTTNVDVLVLGPIEIMGAARPFTRAWAVELVVYLATHPGGVNNDQWATALWPDKAMAPASLHSTASAARRSLGTSESGDDHLPRARGRLSLGPGVRSDWDRFVELSRSAGHEEWRAALDLVRGRPFDGLRSPDWALLEGILATIEAVVVDVACRYAEHCLVALDPAGAEWAARQGLRVSPYDERLYRVLLRAAEAAGNPAGVESVMAELVHLVADDVEPFDAVHPETLELYRRLSRRSLASRGN